MFNWDCIKIKCYNLHIYAIINKENIHIKT